MHLYALTIRFALSLLSLLAACSVVDEMTPRLYVGLLTAHAAPLRFEIAKALLANPGKPVPQAGALPLPPPVGLAPMKFDFGWVTTGGAIVVQSSKYAVMLVQEPVVTSSGVKWTCVVTPADAKPSGCGDER